MSTQTYAMAKPKKRLNHEQVWAYIFVLPFLLFFVSFALWPLLATLIYSLFEWGGSKPLLESNFVGIGNYVKVLKDPVFWVSFRNTIVFALVNTIIKLPLSLAAAIILTRKWLWGQRIFRTVFFAPIVLPVAIAGLIFTILLNPANGAVNEILRNFGLIERSIDFLGNKNTALLTVILVSVWQVFGQYMIYWIAALQDVPEVLYEAAEIDGANEWVKLTRITLPIIAPIATVISLLAFVNALKVFGLIVTMTGGGPGKATSVVSYFIYGQAFQNLPFRYGYASAAALIFGVTMLVIVTLQGKLVNNVRDRQ